MPNYLNEFDIDNRAVSIDDIKRVLKSNFPKSNFAKVDEAYVFAHDAHEGQLRKSGEAYILHPLYVAYLTASIKLDESSVIAALLHDTVEDTKVSLSEIQEKFGEDTAFLVDGLTKIKAVTNKVMADAYEFESIRKLLIASTKDVRVILIKLADRLHNTVTIDGLPPERRITYSQENLKFYAPLADFVGINYFRKKLEDLSFKEIQPEIYSEIKGYLETHTINYQNTKYSRDEFITKHVEYFNAILKDNKVKAAVFGRNKGVYSIYRKIIKKYKDYDIEHIASINDLIGITILTNSISECYKVLGLMHAKHEHIPSLFDDYIAKPKSNGYRAIHTCLVGPDKIKTALQIKTFKMHEYNEYGPASHIYYKEKEKGFNESLIGSKITFLRSLVRWKEEVKNIEYYKVDVFKDKVFVFTPRGDVRELPVGATAVDFAYLIHTNIGNSCNGVKVNGAIKPLSYVLSTGDVVEISTDKRKSVPSRDWLSFVKTPYAKTNIRKAFLEKEEIEEVEYEEEDVKHAEKQEEVYITDLDERKIISEKISEAGLVRIKGIDNIDCVIAKCCSPIPGDDIIGHVTKSRGIRIHKKNCKELEVLDYKVLLEAEWLNSKKEFLTGLYIQGNSDENSAMIREITKLLSDLKVGVDKIDAWNNNGFNAKIAVNISSKNQLESLIKKLKKINKVSNVQRININ